MPKQLISNWSKENSKNRIKIEVIGLGIIGSVIFEELIKTNLFHIIGVEINNDKLQQKISKYQHEKEIVFSDIIIPADIFIICVQTPLTKDKKPDLQYFDKVFHDIINVLKENDLIIVNSTIPPNTMDNAQKILNTYNFHIGENIFLSYCPERILPGENMIKEFKENAKIIAGDQISCEKTNEIYTLITDSKSKCFYTSFINAELIKLAENSYRDINIAFVNELAKISCYYNANIKEIIDLANLHPRVNILQPGLGVGGHCIAVDPFFLMNSDYNRILKTARNVNDSMPLYCFERLKKELPEAKDILILGYSYKPDVLDTRESPALLLANILHKNKYNVYLYNPFIDFNICSFLTRIENIDCIIIGCNHTCFQLYTNDVLKEILNKMINPVILSPFLDEYDNYKKAGFTVINIFQRK